MVVLALLCAAAISIAVTVSLHNERRVASLRSLPAQMRKHQP
jgi:hypothetical protein